MALVILQAVLVTAIFAVPAWLVAYGVSILINVRNKVIGLPWVVRAGGVLYGLSWVFLVIACFMHIYGTYFAEWSSADRQNTFQIFHGVLATIGGLMLGPWLIWRTKDVQRKIAGLEAEEQVGDIIDDVRADIGGSVRHGMLLVFRPGAKNEYSVEIDHLLVTKRNVYVIETKYKSGRINALESSARWTVETAHATSDMRNGLRQVKNTIETLCRSINAFKGVRVVPLVAVVGNNVEIINGPSNVLEASRLRRVVDAFEANTKGGDIDVDAFIAAVQVHVSTDKKAFVNHVARANTKEAEWREQARKEQEQAEFKKIVNEASINGANRYQVVSEAGGDGNSSRS